MSDWPVLLDLWVAALLLIGAGFALVGSLGLVRLETFMQRLHAPTKATTLGVGSLLMAVFSASAWDTGGLSLRELLLALLVFWTAPLAAQQLARAWLRRHGPD